MFYVREARKIDHQWRIRRRKSRIVSAASASFRTLKAPYA